MRINIIISSWILTMQYLKMGKIYQVLMLALF